ncbi:MAG: iron-sulfur cluster assembly scaffold protein [Acidobacteriota bacterium]|nr:iron-sulfur cluster assembly scaffold protein [Acidobacteriota bacterium]
MSFYPPKINERFLEPTNAGKIESPSAVGTSGSFVCGAALKLFLQIEDGKIITAKFQAAGCGFLFTAADTLCAGIENKTFAEIGKAVRANENLFVAVFENDFPSDRTHCLELCLEALRSAINDYRAGKLESWNGDEALICTCFGVSETQIEAAIVKNGLTTVEEVTEICKAGGGCGSCQPLILDVLDGVCRNSL